MDTSKTSATRAVAITTALTLFVTGFEIFVAYTNYKQGMNFIEYGSCPFYNEVSPIKVRNLLSMRSGIHDFVNDPMGFWGEEQVLQVIVPMSGLLRN